jgi:iron(III) transport system permease protein
VTLPIVRLALLAALIYFIIVVIESFDIPGLLGFTARIRVLSTAIYWATHSEVGLPDYGLASALGTLVLAVALLLMWMYHRLTAHQERFATITGKGYRPRQINLGRWTWPAQLLCVIFVFVAVLLPFLMLLWTSVQPFYAPPSVESLGRATVEGYRNIWHDNSVVRAVCNPVLALVVATNGVNFVGWFVVQVTRVGRARRLSRHRIVSTSGGAEHRHRFGAHLCLCSFSHSHLRHDLDHCARHDDSVPRL